jgi:hypothetical protein
MFKAVINATSSAECCTIAVSIGFLWLPDLRQLILPDFQCSFYFGETKVTISQSESGAQKEQVSFAILPG